jgi:hypothetical protein
MMEELFKTGRTFQELYLKLLDPKTYLGELTQDEINESLSKFTEGFFRIFQLNFEYWMKAMEKIMAGDADGALEVYLQYISALEDTAAEMADSPLYSAFINAFNTSYLRSLISLQNLNSAFLHNLGLVSRRDVIALAEAYVDLKGDIKRETRMIRREIEELKRMILGGGEK